MIMVIGQFNCHITHRESIGHCDNSGVRKTHWTMVAVSDARHRNTGEQWSKTMQKRMIMLKKIIDFYDFYGLWCFHDMVRACSSVKCIPPLELNLEWLEWLESIRSPIPGGQWIGTGTAIATLRLGRTPGNLGRRSSWDVTRHWKGHKKHIDMCRNANKCSKTL